MRNGNVKKWLHERVVQSYHSTILGCLFAALASVGNYLEGTEEYRPYGQIITALSALGGAVGLILVKQQEKNPG